MVERTVRKFLVNKTLTFSDPELVDVERVDIAWRKNEHGKNKQEGIIRIVVRVTDPELPSYKQVTLVQEEINKLLQSDYQLVVQRTAVDVVGPKQVIPSAQESLNAEIDQPAQNNKEGTDNPEINPLPQKSSDQPDENRDRLIE